VTDEDFDQDEPQGLRDRLGRQGEEALGRFAQDLLDNPLISAAVSRAFEAREKAAQAQEVAFNALNIPSAADIERLTRRVRQVSQRLEGIEDGVDRVEERMGKLQGPPRTPEGLGNVDERLGAIEVHLATLARELAALRDALPDATPPVPSNQERLRMEQEG
jgi:hypothetical protein